MSGHGGFPISSSLLLWAGEAAAQSNLESGSEPTGFNPLLPELLQDKFSKKAGGTPNLSITGVPPSRSINGMKGFRLFFAPEDMVRGNILPKLPQSQLSAPQLQSLISRLALRMYRPYPWEYQAALADGHSTGTQAWDNPDIPSGYTYLLQLVAHDLVASSFSVAILEELATGTVNTRSSALRLDTIYGGGPAVCPFAYKSHYEKDETRTALQVGQARDIVRAPPPSSEEAYIELPPDDSRPDQPRSLTEPAIVDPRNDNNAIVAQITSLFHLLHNSILDILLRKDASKEDFDPSKQEAQMKRYFCARGAVSLIYRNIIRKDLLRLILHKDVYEEYNIEHFFEAGASSVAFIDKSAATPGGDARIPLEFSHAVFRFGHAMVRPRYRFNERNGEGFSLMQVLRQNSSKNPSFMPLNADWIIRWSYFFKFKNKAYNDGRLNLSRRIGPLFSQDFLSPDLFPALDNYKGGLAYRDLIGAELLGLWSAQDVIEAIQNKRSELLQKSKWLITGKYIDDLRRYLTTDAESMNLTDDVDRLVDRTPLELFILVEAAADPDTQGKRLGLIGSIIVAEVILAAMIRDPVLGEVGATSLKGAFEKLSAAVYNKDTTRLDGVKEIASMDGLIEFVAQERNLTSEESKFI